MSDRITRIAIVGDGLEGWMAALFLAHNLSPKLTTITVCPSNRACDFDVFYASSPEDILPFFTALGINEEVLLNACNATYKIGVRYEGFGGGVRLSPFGSVGEDWLGSAFHHHWLRARQLGLSNKYFEFAPAAQAMAVNTFAPKDERNRIGDLQHEVGVHFDPVLFTANLKRIAVNMSVECSAPFQSAVFDNNNSHIDSITTDTGASINADIFIDASGPARRLLSQFPHFAPNPSDGRQGFKTVIDKIPATAPPPYTSVRAEAQGWFIQIPLAASTLTVSLSRQENATDEKPGETCFTPGSATAPWVGNCVAIGHAAMIAPPVDATGMKLLRQELQLLIDLLPGAECAPAETDEYNRLFRQEAHEVEAFINVHEIARAAGTLDPTKLDESALAIDDDLLNRLRLFAERGWVSPIDGELLTKKDWACVFLLHDLIPARYDILAERMPADALQEKLEKLLIAIKKITAEFPPHPAFLQAVKSALAQRAQKAQRP